MPVRLLTDAQRDRLAAFPREVPVEDPHAHFTLTGRDRAAVPERSAPAIRLGFALSLCAVRYLGFCPENLASWPEDVAWYVSQQLGLAPGALAGYPEGGHTRAGHLRRIHAHLGYRRPTPADLRELFGWLVRRALEHDDPALLVRLAAEKLKAEKVARPGVSRLEMMVAAARGRTDELIHRALSPVLTEGLRTRLDGLLEVDPSLSPARTRHAWLKEGATSNTPRAIAGQLEKLAFLRDLGADGFDVSGVNPNRLRFLAGLGRRHTNQALGRLAPERRHPMLAAFLSEAHAGITDETVDLFDACLGHADARARRELDEFRKGSARATNEKVALFRELALVLLDPTVEDSAVRSAVHEKVGAPEDLLDLVEEAERLMRPPDDNHLDFFAARYPYVRRFAPAFLSAFSFRSGRPDDPLSAAIERLRELDDGGRRSVPDGAPLGFVPARWGPHVVGEDGKIDRRHWELCLLWQLRGALRSGDVWVEGARRHADPQGFLAPKNRWPDLRGEVSLQTGTSPDGAAHLDVCREELGAVVGRLRLAASRGATVKVQAGRILFDRDPAEVIPESVEDLGREIAGRLPKVELTDLLVDVDRWCGFSRFFTHAGGSEPRSADLRVHLYASILAQATNIGPVRMAELSDLSYRKLAWASTWYLREDTLKDAVAAIVNFHHALPLSGSWGDGTLSSSDGQRLAVDVEARNARAIPRYFGRGRGVTHYSWTSEQYSQYGTKVGPSTVRDATHVLDGILGNETDLPISEHTVDTHGFTEIVFALFAALGLRFSPRIRDLSDQMLYRMEGVGSGDGPRTEAFAKDLLRGKINEKLILRRWDDILRVVGSLKLGWTPASLLVSRLQAKPRKSGLARAIQEYGRLQKTLFILRYAEDLDLRRRVGRQLNKGEELGALKDFLFFANDGNIRKHQPEEQTDQALCLSLLVDAVILWNTVHYQEALDAIRAEGYPVNDEDLAHLSPRRYARINPYGRYRFDLGGDPAEVPGGEPEEAEPRLPGTF
ncbi:Tn3 family transposase (plasmid) [Rubrobacter tropicus]|uniref:Tn3 family transposase n=1 Tax=Rubrobacter tropicus TaxID=2653851 RepID=A0A6G8QFY7_9ACTN|nr:Tn3 family transposase [Rubrobacter tropicus]QIN85414.1 Tn3 family transposase [Rubrobacter tropicus]